jgi:hypothetical protein
VQGSVQSIQPGALMRNLSRVRCRLYFGVLICLTLCQVGVAAKKIPQGKGEWIDYPSHAIEAINSAYGTNYKTIGDLAAFVKSRGCTWVAVKCAGGTEATKDFTPELVAIFHKLDIQVYGWDLVTGASSAKDEGVLVRRLMDTTGADGLIVMPYVSVWSKGEIFYERGSEKADDYWTGLMSKGKPRFSIGYSGDSSRLKPHKITENRALDGEAVHKYFELKEIDFFVPRVFWRWDSPERLEEEIQTSMRNWNAGVRFERRKPVVLLGQCQGKAGSYDVITKFAALAYQNKVSGMALFRLDNFSPGDFARW